MPRNAGARGTWWSIVAVAALAAGCGDDVVVASDGGSTPADAAIDAAIEDAAIDAGVDSGEAPPWSFFDSGIINVDEPLCALRIAAQCDGPEDCATGACCARFAPTDVSFTAIECLDECDFQQSFPLCHEGQVCTADGKTTCRTSPLIPGEFIGVCAPRTELSRLSPPPTSEAIEGAIVCGDDECVAGEEQCCIRESFDLKRFVPIKREPFCAPIGEPCDCADPPRDGSVPNDEDGGL